MLKTRIVLNQEELELIVTRCNGNLAELEKIQEQKVSTIEELKGKIIKKHYCGLDIICQEDEYGTPLYPHLHDVIEDMNIKKGETVYLNEVLDHINYLYEEEDYEEEFIKYAEEELVKTEFGSLEYIY